MRRRWLSVTGVLLGLFAGLTLSQCFAPTYADCAFRCGTVAPVCPDEYQCQADGYCHRPDSVATCPVALDFAAARDLSTDGSVSDLVDTD